MKQKKLTIGHRFQFQRRWWPQVCKPMALIKASRKINKRAPVRRISEDDERLLLPDVPSGFEIRNCYFHRLPSGDAIAATGYRLFNDAVTLTVRADCVRIFTHRTLKFSFLRWWRLWCWVIDVSAKDLALWWRSVALLCFGSVSRVGRVWKQAISVTDLLPNSPCRTHRLVHVHETPPGGREVEKKCNLKFPSWYSSAGRVSTCWANQRRHLEATGSLFICIITLAAHPQEQKRP